VEEMSCYPIFADLLLLFWQIGLTFTILGRSRTAASSSASFLMLAEEKRGGEEDLPHPTLRAVISQGKNAT